MNEDFILKQMAVFAPIEHLDWQLALQALNQENLDGVALERAKAVEAEARSSCLKASDWVFCLAHFGVASGNGK